MPTDVHSSTSLDARPEATDLPDAADVASPNTTMDVLTDAAPTPGLQSPIQNVDDLRRLNRRATQTGMYTGMVGGAILTYAAHKMRMPKNGLVLTFLLSSTGISFLYTRNVIRSTLGTHYEVMRAQHEPVAPGGGTYLGDETSSGDAAAPKTGHAVTKELDPRVKLLQELEKIKTVDMARERTVWAKGRGLEGEVEEEEEMVDKYLRPGMPRRDV